MTLADILDRPIAFQRSFVRVTGSINAALFLSQAMYWSKRTDDDGGWFYKKQADWEDETGLTRREQETARKNLKEVGILEEQLRGLPAILYYRICLEKLRTSLSETATTVCPKQPSQYGANRQTNAETTSEITTETTKEEAVEFVETWNKSGFVKCMQLTSKRKEHLRARFKSKPWRENWMKALAIMKISPFCCGQNDRGWVPDIDWFIRSDDAVAKALEGKYGAKQPIAAKPVIPAGIAPAEFNPERLALNRKGNL